MKKMMMIILSLGSFAAKADLATQMNNIVGDWDSKSNNIVLRVEAQSGNQVLAYHCNRSQYYQSPNQQCNYSKVEVYAYRSDIDAFFGPQTETRCSASFQVGMNGQLAYTSDPYSADRACSISGKTELLEKI